MEERQDIGVLNFHRVNFRQPPLMTFDITEDWAQQSVSNKLHYPEREIRWMLKNFPRSELRTGCEIVSREQVDDYTIIEFVGQDGLRRLLRTSWLVGADGKRGVVRKRFLEPEWIRQEEIEWTYVGAWVAANLQITTPTPQSHPDFCKDSKRPAVSGRFGTPGSANRHSSRHEYSIELEDSLADVESQFWVIFGPRIACSFGDAADVFPAFGGQGIAAGIIDAQSLGWRLAMMSRLNTSSETQKRILTGWSQEPLCDSWKPPFFARYRTHNAFRDKLAYNHQTCPDGFFLKKAGGGRNIAQIWVREHTQQPRLFDAALLRNLSHLAPLVLVRNPAEFNPAEVAQILKQAALPGCIVTMEDVTFYANASTELLKEGVNPSKGYSCTAIQDRFASSTKFAIISVASSNAEFRANLEQVSENFI
ncbi:hypothetical protein B0T25DRAFT_589071 [Lasiosphaeria hispida]|uniref:FAD-binding domain-containing protein n=1 Tax=Lasiosphaeria hispida TaxID=260671 RepID=A0AAJ0MF75_9PEZI|nr:hypothetical protein B0T25DRAFT_589071 [Lasiosphaeria hispida]